MAAAAHQQVVLTRETVGLAEAAAAVVLAVTPAGQAVLVVAVAAPLDMALMVG